MTTDITLETEIRKALENGLTGLTLFRSPSGRWQASERNAASGTSWAVFTADDPIDALMAVLTPTSKAYLALRVAVAKAVKARS